MNTPGNKLTKKQKKSLAFRGRKTGRRKDNNGSFMDAENSNLVPTMENQDLADAQGVLVEVEKESENGRPLETSFGKAKAKHRDEQTAKPEKRQREGEEIMEQHPRKAKRAKVLDDVRETDEKKVASTQRFILFVGMPLSLPLLVSHNTEYKEISSIRRRWR
jgi:nucleolar protein 6